MRHIRMVVPSDLAQPVLELLTDSPEVTNVWSMPGAAHKPVGDLISCDVAAEQTSTLISQLERLGLAARGSIAVEEVDAVRSVSAERAERAAPGSVADAVVWEEVEKRVEDSAELSFGYLVLMIIATLIATVGILVDSVVLVIGAMVVGPEFGPLAGISVALVNRQWRLAQRSVRALLIGFPSAIASAAVLVLILRATGVVEGVPVEDRFFTDFVSRPNLYSAIIALLAGVAGMMAITGAKSGTLVGVLISVTTIPAAADMGVSLAFGDRVELTGAASQLVINLTCLILAAMAVLFIQRGALRRRIRASASGR